LSETNENGRKWDAKYHAKNLLNAIKVILIRNEVWLIIDGKEIGFDPQK